MDKKSLLAWCSVPAGKFLYSVYEGKYEGKHAFYDMTYNYDLSKYPVTNAQFAEFIADDGYQQKAYWTKSGWQLKTQENWTTPKYWSEANYNQAKQPVVGISWYEAYAYTQWLSEKVGYAVRLPSEPEWEKAARTPDSYQFPWGNEWDAAKCHNSVEKRYDYPAEVDAFPNGVSVNGIVDMAGNVKEMCMSAKRTESIAAEDNNARFNSGSMFQRIVRSQSHWGTASYTFSTTFRSAMFPEQRLDDIGFRLMRYS